MSSGQAPLAEMVGLQPADLADLVARMTRMELTLACAESLTGGLLAAVITEVPGASAVLRGGLVVYATDLKHSLAGVEQQLLDERGPVDPDVAVALAVGARSVCRAEVGLGLTGVAGPDPQNGVAVGTWHVALATSTASRVVSNVRSADEVQELGRDRVRAQAVRAAVRLLDELVQP